MDERRNPRPSRPAPGKEKGKESEAKESEGYVRGENPILVDGQPGDMAGEGPEDRNPEGSVDISNERYRELNREE